jgi:hypothetical protein
MRSNVPALTTINCSEGCDSMRPNAAANVVCWARRRTCCCDWQRSWLRTSRLDVVAIFAGIETMHFKQARGPLWTARDGLVWRSIAPLVY